MYTYSMDCLKHGNS